ncbi:hypothetical protein N9V56_02370 [Alphaproteobacteria bacterium]|nr:hypothetical protein [Alphaproteobacteria bacterium]
MIILRKFIAIRVSLEEEEAGLDRSSHSETAYNYLILINRRIV